MIAKTDALAKKIVGKFQHQPDSNSWTGALLRDCQ